MLERASVSSGVVCAFLRSGHVPPPPCCITGGGCVHAAPAPGQEASATWVERDASLSNAGRACMCAAGKHQSTVRCCPPRPVESPHELGLLLCRRQHLDLKYTMRPHGLYAGRPTVRHFCAMAGAKGRTGGQSPRQVNYQGKRAEHGSVHQTKRVLGHLISPRTGDTADARTYRHRRCKHLT